MWEAFKDMREERINNKLNKKRFNVAPEFLRMRPDKFLEIINSHENEWSHKNIPNLIVKELSDRIAVCQEYAEKTNEALSELPSVKKINQDTYPTEHKWTATPA